MSCLPDMTVLMLDYTCGPSAEKGCHQSLVPPLRSKPTKQTALWTPRWCSPVGVLGMSQRFAQSRSRECALPAPPGLSSTIKQRLPPKVVNYTEETTVNKMRVTLVITDSPGQVIRAQCFPASQHSQGTESLQSQSRSFTAWDIKHMRGWGCMNVLDKEKKLL